jgi:hypothetical protein
MKHITYTTLDRTALGWPSGPWDDEPDKVQWPDETTGLPCLAVRHPQWGSWCGYVGVPPTHPLHGAHYDDVNADAHGGLTFSRACSPNETEATGVCHLPEPGEPKHIWWFGFDCAHCYDYSPNDVKLGIERGYPYGPMDHQVYRTLAYVRAECAQLAVQLKDLNTAP